MNHNKSLNYVISLPNAGQRREHIIKEFSQKNIPFHFFDAFTPSDKIDIPTDRFFSIINQTQLSSGEKGCLISHLMLWKKCRDERLDYICIFEDDILLGENAEKFLAQSDWLKERFDFNQTFVIKLESFLMPVQRYTDKNLSSYQNRFFSKLHSIHFGTAGYIISYGAAEYLLNLFQALSASDIKPIDELIFNKWLSDSNLVVYQLEPALCAQEQQINRENSQLTSQLQYERKRTNAKLKPKKTLRQRLIRIRENLYRIFTKRKRKREAEHQEQIRNEQSVPFL